MGGVLSILTYMATFTYISLQIISMMDQQFDDQQGYTITNPMTQGNNYANMSESNLYPSLEILTVLSDFEKETGGIDIQRNSSKTGFEIDMKKLSRFIDVVLQIQILKDATQKFYKVPFVKCKIENFTKRGVKMPKNWKERYDQRLCPDEDKLQQYEWAVKNQYANKNDRISFSVDVIKCMDQYSKFGCETDDKIKKMLDNVYFVSHMVVKRIEFQDPHWWYDAGSPIITRDV